MITGLADYFAGTASRAYNQRVSRKLARILGNCIDEGIHELVDNSLLSPSQTVGLKDFVFSGLLPSITEDALSGRYRELWTRDPSCYISVREKMMPVFERMGERLCERLSESISAIMAFYDQRDTLGLMVGDDPDPESIGHAFRERYATKEEFISSRIEFDCAFNDLDNLLALPLTDEDIIRRTLLDEPLEVARDNHLLGAYKLQAREFFG